MRWSRRCCFLSITILLNSLLCCAQTGTSLRADTPEAKSWRISGRVLTTGGDPLSKVAVRLDISSPAESQQRMETDVQGGFITEIRSNQTPGPPLQGILIASKKGYSEGRETVNLGFNEKNTSVEIVLHELEEDPDRLSATALIGTLAPRLRNDAIKEFPEECSREEFARGFVELVDRSNPVAAATLFTISVERTPHCLQCRLFLSLALLGAGSWTSANKQLEEALKRDESSVPKHPESALMKGAFSAWRGQFKEAIELYQQTLRSDPKNFLALQELGRAFIALRNWDAANQHLDGAIKAGAGNDARLLRANALLQLGNLSEAALELNRYAGGRKISKLPKSARALDYRVRTHLALLSQNQGVSMIALPAEDLIKILPGLNELEANEDQSILAEVLRKTGESVETFFERIPNTACRERVHQERLGRDGKTKASLDQEFQYLMLTLAHKSGFGIEEIRSTPEGQDSLMAGRKQGLMLTSGFASSSSVFHPVNRNGADFRYLGRQTIDDAETHVIAFAQKPETARMLTRVTTDRGSAIVLNQGVAWVDTSSFQIVRLYTSLLNPVPRIQLLGMTTEIQFHPVSLSKKSAMIWLPQEVEIMVDNGVNLFRNSHRYSDFKLFSVESKEERKPVPVPEIIP